MTTGSPTPKGRPERVLLVRAAPGQVEARELSGGVAGPPVRLPEEELPGFVRQRPRTRWVWDDTTRWYPALLDAGVRITRCTDLRLTHALLRRSPFAARALLVADESAGWAALQPVTATDPALFPLADPADRLDPLAEHRRQQAVLAASPERRRLELLLAAESSGALVAAEMTHAGLPWRTDVHEDRKSVV